MNKLFLLLSFLMGAVVLSSNYLVQFPIKYYGLDEILTYGAFSYPIAFLITDLANRSYGKIIARFNGRMEWGARALGNRSIIADGRNPDVVIKINEAIKNRDFWMPFAPSILYERVNDYFDNPKKFFGPYMVMAFPSKPLAKNHILGGLHPYDFTGRPQMVKKEWNSDYYELLKSFEKYSNGVGGILNTSFNIHGEAIVRTPKDAMDTFLNSGLDCLSIGPFFVEKKN